MTMFDYNAACAAAATRQGLDPVMAALAEREIPFTLEQTGGFTMVVTVQSGETVYAIVEDGGYLLGQFTAEAWRETGEEALSESSFSDVAALVDFVEKN